MRDLTQGSILRNLIFFSLPMLIGNLLQTGYNIVDTFFVGRLGAEAVGGVSMSFTVLFVLASLGIGLTIGVTTLVSQYAGAKDFDSVSRVIHNALVFIGLSAVAITLISLALSRPILTLLKAPPEVFPLALTYFRIIMAGLPFSFLFFAFQAILRGLGDSKTPLFFMGISSVVNIVLDPLLIFGIGPFPRLEVAGAAYATIIAHLVATAFGIYHIQTRPNSWLRLSWSRLRMEGSVVREIIRLGLPAGVGQTVAALGGTVVVRIVTGFGASPLAVWGIGQRLDAFTFMPAMSLSLATAAMVGQNLGAGEEKRAWQSGRMAVGICVLILTLISIFYLIIPQVLFGIFAPTEPQVVAGGVRYLRIISLSYIPFGVMLVLGGVLRGAGDMAMNMWINIFNLWLLRIPLAYLLAYPLGLSSDGIWWAIALSNLSGMAIMVWYYRSGRWATKLAINRSPQKA